MKYQLIQGDNRETLKTIADRFHTKYTIDPQTDCWNWKGSQDAEGYGVFWDNRVKNNVRAHRLSMELNGTPIPKHLHTLHQCDNKRCVNPAHLTAGTSQQNTQEAKERGLLKGMSQKRRDYIRSLSEEEFKEWCKRFEGKTGRATANLITALKWRAL